MRCPSSGKAAGWTDLRHCRLTSRLTTGRCRLKSSHLPTSRSPFSSRGNVREFTARAVGRGHAPARRRPVRSGHTRFRDAEVLRRATFTLGSAYKDPHTVLVGARWLGDTAAHRRSSQHVHGRTRRGIRWRVTCGGSRQSARPMQRTMPVSCVGTPAGLKAPLRGLIDPMISRTGGRRSPCAISRSPPRTPNPG